jgi:thiol:disulfide interchange protein DsbD
MHGVVFTTGVLISFWILAGVLMLLHAGGRELGWGFQLQYPGFVFALSVFLLIFALNLSGLFEVGLSATSVGGSLQMKEGYAGSFFTGVLATVVSTPCAAPFLAPALGAAVALPPVQSFVLFTIIGLGLSMPYLVLSIFPNLVKFLPRPGAWMETFKQLMAFPLYATVGLLLWVLAAQVEPTDFLFVILALVLVSMASWAYGRFFQGPGSRARRSFGAVAACALLAAALVFGFPGAGDAKAAASEDAIAWQTWSPEQVAKLRAEGKIVYVDFTARWCITCQSNKALVFSSKDVREAFKRKGVVPLEADWTKYDPEITRTLASFGRSAVPFNLIYAPGIDEPIQLPELLTPGKVLEALDDLPERASALAP